MAKNKKQAKQALRHKPAEKGTGGVVRLHPVIAIGLLFRTPHGLSEVSAEDRAAYQAFSTKAMTKIVLNIEPVICLKAKPQEATVLTKVMHYNASDLIEASKDQVIEQAKKEEFDRMTGVKMKVLEQDLDVSLSKMNNPYKKVAVSFEKASLSKHGLTICFDRNEVLEAEIAHRKRAEKMKNFEIIDMSTETVVHLMRHWGRSYADISKVVRNIEKLRAEFKKKDAPENKPR